MLKKTIEQHSRNVEGEFFWVVDGENVALADSSDDIVKQFVDLTGTAKKVSTGKVLSAIEAVQEAYKKAFESELNTLKKRIALDEVSKQVCWHNIENRTMVPLDYENIIYQYQLYGLVRARSNFGSYEMYRADSCLSDEFVIATVKELALNLNKQQDADRIRTMGELKSKVIAAKKIAEELDISLLEYLLILQNIEINRSKNARKSDLLFTHIDEEDLNELIK